MFKKILPLIRQQLTQGATLHGIALSCTLGVVIGLFPIIGTTTALCFIVGATMKLNQPLMQLVNYVLYPVHLLSIPVFIYFGEKLVNAPHVLVAPEIMMHEFRADFKMFLAHFGFVVVYAILAWAITMPVLGAGIYFGLRQLLKNKFPSAKI